MTPNPNTHLFSTELSGWTQADENCQCKGCGVRIQKKAKCYILASENVGDPSPIFGIYCTMKCAGAIIWKALKQRTLH